MIDIFSRIYLGILIFLSAITVLAIIIAFILLIVWAIVEIVKDIFG